MHKSTWQLTLNPDGKSIYKWAPNQWQCDIKRSLDTERIEKRYRDQLIQMGISKKQLEKLLPPRTEDSSLKNKLKIYQSLHEEMKAGSSDAAEEIFNFLEDWARLRFTLYVWELRKSGEVTGEVWGRTLILAWQRGKTECLLLRAKISKSKIVEMFAKASPASLMGNPGEYDRYLGLPKKITIWRGANHNSKFKNNGLSWSLNKDQAQWFAYRFSSEHSQPILIRAVIPKCAVLAALDYEQEIIVSPQHIIKVSAEETLSNASKATILKQLKARIQKGKSAQSKKVNLSKRKMKQK